MRFLSAFFLILSLPLYGEITYYNSNKSGMVLGPISYSNAGEFYVSKDEDIDKWSQLFIFFQNKNITKSRTEFYTANFNELIKIEFLDDNSKIIELYSNNLLVKSEKYEDDILKYEEAYDYNNKRELIKVENLNSDGEIIYTENFYRNQDGSLRKLLKSSSGGYYNHWFYKNGIIIETWLVEDDIATRTKYDNEGKVLAVIRYDGEEIVSVEDLTYSDLGNLKLSIKKSGSILLEKKYDLDGNITENRLLDNDILLRKTMYVYRDNLLFKETIIGHGKREEFVYERDNSDDISSILYYINSVLKKIEYIDSEDSEIFEYYRDDQIYLKEYYFQGERIKRDLYLNGKLFKSESISE